MGLKEKLLQDMQAAMKAREEGKTRLSVLRLARAAIKNAEIEKRRELDDSGVLEVLAREVKQRRDAIQEYERAGRPETVSLLKKEIEILQEYLPRPLSEGELRELVKQAMAETGAREGRELGKVMGWLMPRVKGRADGKTVNRVASEMLTGG